MSGHTRLIAHLLEQGSLVREEIGGCFGIKVLSDLDDTLHCSGGHNKNMIIIVTIHYHYYHYDYVY